MRWTIRGIGLTSTIILARILYPEDFGLVAMAMVGIGFLEVFTHTGVDLALIRTPDVTRKHFDSAWTLEIGLGLTLATVLVLLAPLAALYFDEPRVVAVIRCLALRAAIGGFENVGVINFRRDLDFSREYRFQVLKKLVNFTITITLALILRNYWALVISMVTARAISVALSYVLHPFRPRLDTSCIGEIWSFSGWLVFSRIGRYLTRKTDEFIVGGFAGTAAMGNYHVASDVATAPTDEMVLPMARGLYPVYAKLAGDPEGLARAFRNVLTVIAMLCVSAGLGMLVVADDMVRVILGAKWMETVPLIRWLAVYGAVAGISGAFETLLTVTARVRALSFTTWLVFGLQVPAYLYAAGTWGIVGVAAARTVVALAASPIIMALAIRGTSTTAAQVFGALWPRVLAGAVMVGAVVSIPLADGLPDAVRLIAKVGVGMAAFSIATIVLWVLRGKPDGPERAILARIPIRSE